jgi:hypothetical protein
MFPTNAIFNLVGKMHHVDKATSQLVTIFTKKGFPVKTIQLNPAAAAAAPAAATKHCCCCSVKHAAAAPTLLRSVDSSATAPWKSHIKNEIYSILNPQITKDFHDNKIIINKCGEIPNAELTELNRYIRWYNVHPRAFYVFSSLEEDADATRRVKYMDVYNQITQVYDLDMSVEMHENVMDLYVTPMNM